MRRRKLHIAILPFLMLILFVSPMAVKAVHHHLSVQMPAPSYPQDKSLAAAKDACPVCQFEFVTFIAFGYPEYTHYSLLSSFDGYEPTLDIKGNSVCYCSLRAPPAF
jgi:hypothetical protein